MTTYGSLAGGGEFEVLRRILARASERGAALETGAVAVGPGDDAAVLEGGWVISTDQMVEGVHFLAGWMSDGEVGGRAIRAGLSDLAAMAAEPVGVLVSLAMSGADATSRIESVMDGAIQSAAEFGARVLGGDLSKMPAGGPMVMDAVVLGRSPAPLLRSGAVAGDELWVTGPLGGAAAAVGAWRAGVDPAPEARVAFTTPVPRTREAQWIAARADLHAGIDLSDGLLADAAHMAAASGVRLLIEPDVVPRHPSLTGVSREESARHALAGGEDYELLIAVAAGSLDHLTQEYAHRFGVEMTRVGNVNPGAGVAIRAPDGHLSSVDTRSGYNHFPETPT